jgi:hypothetical protein
MAITAQQERELLNAMQDLIDTKRRANRFVNASDRQIELIGSISIIISRKLGISVSSARSYIDGKTGRFKDAGYMPYCTDPELKKLYAELEKVTTEINALKWKTKAEAVQAVAAKQQKVLALADKIKKQPGAQAVIDRVKAQVK